MTLVANSRMYNATADIRLAWDRLFSFVREGSEIVLKIIDHPAPAPLEALWLRPDLGCVFICGWPFAKATVPPRLVCAPVLRPHRYGAKPVYVTDFVVRADHSASTLEETFGGRLAWTADHSHSGYNAVRYHLLHYRSGARQRLFRETVGPLITPQGVIDAVMNGQADVGPVDGWYLDLLRRNDPDSVAGLRVVATTGPAPVPPLVAHPGLPEAQLARLRRAFLDAPRKHSLEPVLKILLIRDFVVPEPHDYDLTLQWEREAIMAGAKSLSQL